MCRPRKGSLDVINLKCVESSFAISIFKTIIRNSLLQRIDLKLNILLIISLSKCNVVDGYLVSKYRSGYLIL